MTSDSGSRSVKFERPIHLREQLIPLRRGSGDPTWSDDGHGGIWRTTLTPDGPGLELLLLDRSNGSVEQTAWGPGAQWLLSRLPRLLGADDDPGSFSPPKMLAPTASKYSGWRVGRTDRVLEAAAAAVLEQKVTGKEAWRSWRELVRKFGSRISPSGSDRALWVVPDAETWTQIPSWEWHQAGVDSKRSKALIAVMRGGSRIEDAPDLATAQKRLRPIAGIGVWTVAEISQRALGDPDAISFGDYHLAKQIVHAFTGRRNGTDEELAELLTPWNGDRYRIQRLYELSPLERPRRGPKMTIYDMRDR